LAAQYRFGARTGWSIVILGFVKLLSGLLFGDSLSELFKQFPKSIIGILLIVAGLQIALVTVNLGSYKSISKREDAYLIMILTATSIVGFANDGIGFLIGSVAAAILHYTNIDVADVESSLAAQNATTVVTVEAEA
jgi:MFS superfamily sulfate permease-like transporter